MRGTAAPRFEAPDGEVHEVAGTIGQSAVEAAVLASSLRTAGSR